MSNDLNLCQFIGRLGQDPEIRHTAGGDPIANLSIACGRSWKDKSGQKQEQTEWIRVVAFRKLAEIIGEYLKKGSQVYINGRMQTRKYEKDGQTHYSTEILADQMQMLGSKGDAGGGGYQKPQQQAPAPAGGVDFNDDVPFMPVHHIV